MSMGYSQGDEIALFNANYPPKKGVVTKVTPSGQVAVETKGAMGPVTHRFTPRGYEVGTTHSWSRNYWYIEPKNKADARFAEQSLMWMEKNFFGFANRELEALARCPQHDRTTEARQKLIEGVRGVLAKLEQKHAAIAAAKQQ